MRTLQTLFGAASLAGALHGGAADLPAFSGSLAAQTHREHPLQTAAGDFVHGRLRGKDMRLVLIDRDGQRAKILAKGQREEQEFMFVAGDRGPYLLDVRAPTAGDYQLSLLRQVPRADQVAPQPVPDSPRLAALQQLLARGGDSSAFWREVEATGAPLVEHPAGMGADERLVTFLWRGATRNVRLHGGPSSDHDELARLGTSDVWYRSYRLPVTTRLSYRLAPDVPDFAGSPGERRRAILATVQRDPYNRRSFPLKTLDHYDGASVLELPGAPPQAWVERQPGVPAGSLEKLELASTVLGNTRPVYLYRPHGYRPGAAGNALAVLFDAEWYVDDVPTPVILDNLIATKRLPPTAAILIANPSGDARSAELPPNPRFARFLAEELMPWARARGIAAPASRTVIAGASYGGLAAAYAGLTHPELFGKVYSQSGSFWWAPAGEEEQWLTRQFAAAAPVPVEFLLEAGQFEKGRGDSAGILPTTRHLRDVLRARGYRVNYRDFAAGHDFYHWRGSLGDGLVHLLGAPADGTRRVGGSTVPVAQR